MVCSACLENVGQSIARAIYTPVVTPRICENDLQIDRNDSDVGSDWSFDEEMVDDYWAEDPFWLGDTRRQGFA